MNDLIRVSYKNECPMVMGRELHTALEIRTAYEEWFQKMCEYGFTEGADYLTVGNNTDHRLTVDMAKSVCLFSKTGKSAELREYLNTCELKKADIIADNFLKKFNDDIQAIKEDFIASMTKPKDVLPEQYVYILEKNENSIKIGVSKNVEKRIKSLEKSGGFTRKRVVCFGKIKNGYEVETKSHKKLSDYRTNGEWFNVPFELAVKTVEEIYNLFGDSSIEHIERSEENRKFWETLTSLSH